MTGHDPIDDLWRLAGPFWMLDEGDVPVPAPTMQAWLDWRRANLNLHVGDEIVGESRVSTVFLTSPIHPLSGAPMCFETMIFGGRMGGTGRRYATRDEAVIGHAAAVRAVTMTGPRNEPHTVDRRRPAFICPKCGMPSYHPKDAEQRYCNRCGFVDDPMPPP